MELSSRMQQMKALAMGILLTTVIHLSSFSQQTKDVRNVDSLITHALSLVSTDSLMQNLEHLQNFGTRFMIAPNRRDVAVDIMNTFVEYGIPQVRLDSFQCVTVINYQTLVYDTITWQYNVEAKIPGKSVPQKEIIVLAHYDSVTLDGDNMIDAPGADDNGSGTVALFEIARILGEIEYEPEQTIVLLATAAEELMYFGDSGSEHYAQQCSDSARDVVMVINNDMIGWDNGTFTMNIYNHLSSTHLTALALDIISDYTSLNYYSYPAVTSIGADLQPFLDAGYSGIYFMERGNYPYYHTVSDVTDHVSSAYLAEITKVNIGMILKFDLAIASLQTFSNTSDFIFPNPAQDYIQIHTKEEYSNLFVYNMNGSCVMQIPYSSTINISHLQDGIYTIILSSGHQQSVVRFIKMS